jgi:Family of unknown function (DUF5641)
MYTLPQENKWNHALKMPNIYGSSDIGKMTQHIACRWFKRSTSTSFFFQNFRIEHIFHNFHIQQKTNVKKPLYEGAVQLNMRNQQEPLQEYIPSLQIRSKWTKSNANIQVGDVVRIADEGFSRRWWPMGRVTGVSPGADAVVRVTMVRTAHGLLKRPVTKLAKINL